MKKIPVEFDETFTTDSPIFQAAKMRRIPVVTLLEMAVKEAKPMMQNIIKQHQDRGK